MSARCLRMEASATWGQPLMSLWRFSPAPNSTSGRFCRLAPPATATRPTAGSSAFAGNSLSHQPGISRPTGAGSTENASRAWPDAAAPWTSTRWSSGSSRCSIEAAAIFSTAGHTTPSWPSSGSSFRSFAATEAAWLTDYALYAELRRQYNTGAWTRWPEPLRRREPQALAEAAAKHGRALAQEQALQFAFSVQWNQLREAAARRGIRILGDVAIFVNMDSADVWVHPELFELDENAESGSCRRRAARLLFVHRPALGQPALSLGRAWPSGASTGGSSACAAPASSMTSFASTISAASRPTGRFRPGRRRR